MPRSRSNIGVSRGIRILITTSLARLALWVPSCLALLGCATEVAITPQLADKTPSGKCQIRAPVHYEGKRDYLPAALVDDPNASHATAIRYSFEAQYGLNEFNPFIVFVNPLTLVGFPTGNDNLVVTGRVDVVRGDATLRSYAAAASMKRSSTVFYEGETFTEMRRRGLLLVGNNLSSQLCKDQEVLTALLNDSDNTSPRH
jgi:hypothetical protein